MQIMAKMANFHLFIPTLPPENGFLMDIESWKKIKMSFKSDNLSLDMNPSCRNHNLWTTSKAKWSDPSVRQKKVKIFNYHCF